jgi:hypothetical protein
MMLPKGENGEADARMAWGQLGLIALGVAAIALADLASGFGASTGLTAAGVGLLLLMVWYDERAAIRLLPRGAGDLKTPAGAGYAAKFLLTAATMGFSVYGPAFLQTLAGLKALTAGYIVALEAVAWTTFGLLVSGLVGRWRGWMIRLGAVVALGGVGLCALVFPLGSVAGVAVAGLMLGGGFGLFSAFLNQRVLNALTAEDRAIGAAGLTTVQLIGAAVGAAAAAAAANLTGVSHGLTIAVARSAGFWVFVAVLPVAAAGVAAAWRLGGLTPIEADAEAPLPAHTHA